VTVTVRRVVAYEWADIREVRLGALADDPAAFATTHVDAAGRPDDWWRDAVQRAAFSDTEAMFVADRDGALVGMVAAYEPADDLGSVRLVQMWTNPAIRRSGLGRGLVDAVVDWAGDRPVRLAVRRDNDAARRLYEAKGFVDDPRPAPDDDPCRDEIWLVRRAPSTGR